MEEVKVTRVQNGFMLFGEDAEGTEVLLTKAGRIEGLMIGDMVQGNYLNDDDSPDEFCFEIHSRKPIS